MLQPDHPANEAPRRAAQAERKRVAQIESENAALKATLMSVREAAVLAA